MRITRKVALSLLFPVALLMGAGCGSGNNGGVDNAPKELFGVWRLVRTTGGFTGQGIPFAPGSVVLTFERNGTATLSDGDAITQKKYHVTRRKSIFSDAIVPVVEYEDGSLPQVIDRLDSYTLGLADEAADGIGRIYERATGE